MLIVEVDVDVDGDEARAVALSLLSDAALGWSVQDLVECEPGPYMVSCLSRLDIESLDEVSASVMLELLERQQAWLAEMGVRATVRVAGSTPPPPNPDSADMVERDLIDFGANAVAATLGMTSGGAQARVDAARAITETLPKCQLAMAAGFMGVLAGAGGGSGGV